MCVFKDPSVPYALLQPIASHKNLRSISQARRRLRFVFVEREGKDDDDVADDDNLGAGWFLFIVVFAVLLFTLLLLFLAVLRVCDFTVDVVFLLFRCSVVRLLTL
jgi:hypothetical protein